MLCAPAHHWLRKKTTPRASAAAMTALVLLLGVAPPAVFSWLAIREAVTMGREMSELKEFSPKALTAALSRWSIVRSAIGDQGAVLARIKGSINASGQVLEAAVVGLGKVVPELLLQLAVALIAFFFFLLDGERFVERLLGLGILDRNVQRQLVESYRDTAMSAFLAGLAAAAAQAALIVAGFLVLGVPGAFLAGGATFVFAWLPMLGTVPASAAGMLYLYAQGSTLQMALMAALALGAGLVDNVIRPMILKGRGDMHPLIGLVATLGGIQLFGLFGVFIGPIAAAMLLSLLEIWPAVGLRFGIVPKETP